MTIIVRTTRYAGDRDIDVELAFAPKPYETVDELVERVMSGVPQERRYEAEIVIKATPPVTGDNKGE